MSTKPWAQEIKQKGQTQKQILLRENSTERAQNRSANSSGSSESWKSCQITRTSWKKERGKRRGRREPKAPNPFGSRILYGWNHTKVWNSRPNRRLYNITHFTCFRHASLCCHTKTKFEITTILFYLFAPSALTPSSASSAKVRMT